MARFAGRLTFSVVRVPFFLEPSYDDDEGFSESNVQRKHRMFGSHAAYMDFKKRHGLAPRALAAGIEAPLDEDRVESSTMKSHRVVQHVAKEYGLAAAEALYDDLNTLHFIDGVRLNDAQMLAKAVVRSAPGATEASVTEFLRSGGGTAEIEKSQQLLREYGISGIPRFIVDGQYTLDGAAVADEHAAVFSRIATGPPARAPLFTEALGISGGTLAVPSH